MEPMKNLDFWCTFKWGDDNPCKYGMEGYCYIEPGDTLKDGRYVAQKKLGWDANSTHWIGWDIIDSQYVTLKVQVSDDFSAARGKTEINTLEKIASKDEENQRGVVKLLNHFIHRSRYRNHVCMVLEYLGDNLMKLMACYGPKGLPLRLVKHICLHILDALDYLHTEFSLIHGDIKPENFYLVSTIDPSDDPRKCGASPILPPKKSNDEEETSKIAESCPISLGKLVLSHDNQKGLLDSLDHRCKLISFGDVCSPGEGDIASVRTMPYRPPEVIFVSQPIILPSADIWSFACVCFELATGEYLFPAQYGDDYSRDEDHLALMKQQLDRIPPSMIARGLLCARTWFDNKGRLRNVPTRKRRPIKERLVEDHNFNEKDATELGDFLTWILKYEPTERPTAAKCRRHRWFNDVKDEHGISTSGSRKESKLKNVNDLKDEHVISTSGPRKESKLKNLNDVEDKHFISKSKREKTRLKNVKAVEDEHFTSKSKENGY